MDDELSSEIGEFGGTDRYQVLERIGSGGMGVVYAAFDRLTRTKIGLKLLHEHAPKSLARFKREFRSIQDIQHPNLISLGELREERGLWFFTMELLTGLSFRAFVRPPPVPAPARDAIQPTIMVPQRALPSGLIGTEVRTVGKDELPRSNRRRFHEDRLRHALIQVVRGLSVLHQAHKVHRDIKPSNIIVEPDGRAVILDFGIAFDVREGDRLSGDRVIGTGVYMAPEQLDPAACSPASDYYSVGVLLYEALTGRRPFEGKNAIDVLHRKRAALPPPPSELVPGVPADLDELCMELLAIDPAARPRADEILRRLGDIQPRLDIERAVPEPAFVGRERELAALIEAAQAPVRGQTIFISGDSGMGKSALLGRFQQLPLDALLLPGRCYERESVPFKGIDGVIDALAHHLRALPAAEREPLIPRDAMLMVQLFPDLEPVVRGCAEAGHEAPAVHRGDDSIDSHDFRQRAFSALRELLARLGSNRPVVIAIDDMQWADLDTWLLLAHLTRPPDPPPMVLVLLLRPPKDIDAAGFDKLIDGPVRVFELAPLETADACDLAARLMRAEGREDDALAYLIASESEGHPLFIEQLICHMLESDAGALRATRLEDALRTRIGRLSGPARALLEIIATAGIPSENGIIAAAAELEFDVYQRLIAELRAARLVRTTGMEPRDTVEHEHDRIREAVLAGLTVAERQLVHLCLVRALEATGMSERLPELAVQHLEAAGKHERAAVYALQAAERAMDAMAFERAAGLYRTAVDHGSHSGVDRQRLLLCLAKALVDSGHAYQAAQVYLEAAAAGDQATRLDCMRRAAEHLLSTGHVRRGFEVLRAALSELGVSVPATRGQALRSLLLHRTLLCIHGLRWRERSGSKRARGPSKHFELEIDIYRSAGRALSMVDNVRGADFQARALFHALRLGEPARIAKSLAFEAGYVGSGGSAGRARGRRLLEEARAMAERIGDLHLQAWLCTTGGMLDFFIGEYRRANTALAEAERRFARLGVISWERNSNRIFRLLALRFSGDFKRLRVLHDQYVRDAEERGDLYTSSMIRRSCGIVWLVAGDIEGARAELGRAVWFPSSGGTVLHDWYEVRARAEISLYEGTAGEVLSDVERIIERLRRAFLMRVTSIRVDAMALMARLLLASAHPLALARRRAELSRVRCIMEQLDGEQVPSAQAHAAVLRAGLMGGSRDPGRCVICLRGVEALAQRSGMRWLRESARYARGSLLGGSRGAELMAGAVAWMRSEGIEEPARMVAYALPGVRL